jgi:hypothetical protein
MVARPVICFASIYTRGAMSNDAGETGETGELPQSSDQGWIERVYPDMRAWLSSGIDFGDRKN